jgi:hypothetical protein
MSTVPKPPEAGPQPATMPPPDPLREAKERAAAGDIGTALSLFLNADLGAQSLQQLDGLLRRSVGQASQQSPQQFTCDAFQQSTAFLMYVLLRLQACTLNCVTETDDRLPHRRAELPLELTRDILPNVERMSRLLGEQLQAWASTNRMWKLAGRAKKQPRPKEVDVCPVDDDDTLLDRA